MKLSIITINYNNIEGLRKTYDSIVNQTLGDFEWIIIDGGSTDGSKEFIEERQNKFSYWCSEPDKGVYNAMNKGIAKATGEYLNFMNSGDCFYESQTLQIVFGQNADADILYGDSSQGMGNVVNKVPKKLSVPFFCRTTICHQTAFIKTEFLRQSPYREDLRIVSDWIKFLEWKVDGLRYYHVGCTVAIYDVSGFSAKNYLLMDQERAKEFAFFCSKTNSWLLKIIYWAENTRTNTRLCSIKGLISRLVRKIIYSF